MGGRIRQWIGYFIIVAGLCVLASPFVTGYLDGNKQKEAVETFYSEMPLSEEAADSEKDAESVDQNSPDRTEESSTEATLENPSDSNTANSTEADPTKESDSDDNTAAASENQTEDTEEYSQESQTSEELSSGTSVHTEVVETVTYHKENLNTDSDGFYQAALAYNEELYVSRQANLTSTAATERFSLDATRYGYQENMIGTLWIPRMGVELGLYLGANRTNMAKGAAIFGETSVPLGLPNENTSIAGHRGWRGTAMFRDIQSLQIGDKIYVTTTWATLVYKVCDLLITTPKDNTWCDIRDGRSLITLMTCHPYTQNYQRYVVFAELSETLPGNALTVTTALREQALVEVEETLDLTPHTVTELSEDGTVAEVTIDPVSIEPDGTEYGSVWSNVMILAEKQIYMITLGLTVVVILLGLWLLVVTVRDIRRTKKNRK